MTSSLRKLFDFSGKRVLVTGASSPLGAAIALRFAEAGAFTVLHYNSGREAVRVLEEKLAALGAACVSFQADLSEPAEVKRLFTQVRSAGENLDVCVNNAGIYPVTALTDMPAEEWKRVVETNLSGVHYCTKETAVLMKAEGGKTSSSSASSEPCGNAIVNISSIEAEQPGAGHSHYAASKAGLVAYTKAAAQELGPFGIRVNAVLPGLIDRPGLGTVWPEGVAAYKAAAALGRLGQPQDVADACLFLASPAASWITGAVLRVDGGVGAARGY